MKKIYFDLYPSTTKEFFNIKDNKLSFIDLILNSMTIITTQEGRNNIKIAHYGVLVVSKSSDNKSRLTFYQSNKIFSIYFPFEIDKVNGSFKIYFKSNYISEETISFLKSMLNNFKAEYHLDKEDLLDEIQNEYLDYTGNEDNKDLYFNKVLEVFKELLSLDTGYIRYDSDKANSSGLHPEHHLDIFYSKDSSLKIGLKDRYELDEFLLLLDNNTQIKYISD